MWWNFTARKNKCDNLVLISMISENMLIIAKQLRFLYLTAQFPS